MIIYLRVQFNFNVNILFDIDLNTLMVKFVNLLKYKVFLSCLEHNIYLLSINKCRGACYG